MCTATTSPRISQLGTKAWSARLSWTIWLTLHSNATGVCATRGTLTMREAAGVRPLSWNSSTSAATAAQLWFIFSAKGRVARFQTNSPVCSILFRLSLRPTLQNPMIGGM